MKTRTPRAIALVAAIVALLVLGLRPTGRVAVHPGEVIVVTPGAGGDAVRRLADSTAAPVVRIPDDEPDAAAVARHHPDARSLIVAGWGLDETDLEELEGTPLLPGPSSPVPGVSHLSWRSTLALGDPLTVEGGAPAPGARARLAGPGGPADSGVVGPDGRFRLPPTPTR